MHSLISSHNDEILHPDRIIHLPIVLFRAVGVQDDRAPVFKIGGYQNRAVSNPPRYPPKKNLARPLTDLRYLRDLRDHININIIFK